MTKVRGVRWRVAARFALLVLLPSVVSAGPRHSESHWRIGEPATATSSGTIRRGQAIATHPILPPDLVVVDHQIIDPAKNDVLLAGNTQLVRVPADGVKVPSGTTVYCSARKGVRSSENTSPVKMEIGRIFCLIDHDDDNRFDAYYFCTSEVPGLLIQTKRPFSVNPIAPVSYHSVDAESFNYKLRAEIIYTSTTLGGRKEFGLYVSPEGQETVEDKVQFGDHVYLDISSAPGRLSWLGGEFVIRTVEGGIEVETARPIPAQPLAVHPAWRIF